jgi:type IV secretory pathway VirB10-like protein
MRKTLLISVSAAALIAASGCAFAQGPNTQGAPTSQSAQGSNQNVPAEKIAPTMNRSETPDAKAKVEGKTIGQVEQKGPTDLAAPKRAEGDVKKDDTKAKATENKAMENKATETKPDMKPNDKAASEMNADKSKAEMKGNPKAASDTKTGVTTGQAAAGSKQLTVEQRATIHSVVREHRVQPANNVNFAITVGTAVPRTMKFYPVPAQFVTINREWRGFEYFLVGDRIVIVNPRTLEIVAVVEA